MWTDAHLGIVEGGNKAKDAINFAKNMNILLLGRELPIEIRGNDLQKVDRNPGERRDIMNDIFENMLSDKEFVRDLKEDRSDGPIQAYLTNFEYV